MADDVLLEQVAALLRAAAAEVVLPLFGHLDPSEVSHKAPGELVTVADRRAEEMISAGLRRLAPGSVVVGEEAVAADPGLLGHLPDTGPVWVVDPVDGTANFAAGRPPFAIMVALLTGGETTASWILDPLADELAVARVGAGTVRNGVPVRADPTGGDARVPRGAAMTRFLPTPLRDRVQAGIGRLRDVHDGQHCAGREYLDLLTGEQQFVLFWRTLPWDHAPGVLLVREAGGVARRFDGTEYHPADDRSGLLVATDETTWQTVHSALLA